MATPKEPKKSKNQRLREYLAKHKVITPLEALSKFGIYRLGARIYDLKWKYGWAIRTEMVENKDGDSHAKYTVTHVGRQPLTDI
jgi:hypothetical protein